MEIIACPLEEVPPALLAQVRSLHAQVFGDPDPDRPMHDLALRPLLMLLINDSLLLGFLSVLTKVIVHDGRLYRAAGLSAVVTREDLRGRGHGHQLVTAARERMAATDLDLGIFTCDSALGPFYYRAGWRQLPGTVLVGGTPEVPYASDQPVFDKITMAGFFSADATARRDSFVGVRVGLFPGSIDKLW